MIIALAIEILVLIILLRYTLKQKTGEPFTKNAMRRFIRFGLITGVVLTVLMLAVPMDPHVFFGMNPLVAGALSAFLLAAIPEEIVKFVLFRLAIRNNKEIKNVHDVVIVAVIIAFGFSLIEDIQYTVFDGGGAILRSFVPAHLLFQVVMGYYYGRAKAEKKTVYHVLSLAVPILIHTLFDMFIISLKSIIGDIDTSKLSAEEIMKLPYYNMVIPLFVGMGIVVAATLIATIIVFVNIKRKRESTVMQETLFYRHR